MELINRHKRKLIVLVLFILIVAVINHLDFLTVEKISVFYDFPLYITLLAFLVIFIIKGLVLTVPNSLIYISAGIVFPTWIGIVVVYIGLSISSSISYLLGRKLGEERVTRILSKRKKLIDLLMVNKENQISFCFISRLLHMPFGLVSLFFGALNMPYLKYLFSTLLGITPIMIPVIFVGTSITEPLSSAFLIPFAISLLFTILILLVYKKKIITKPRVAVVLIALQILLFVRLANMVFTFFPIVMLINYLISLFVVLILLKQDKTSAYKISWIVIILLLPMVGGVLYILFGNNRPLKKVTKHWEEHALMAKALEENTNKKVILNKDARIDGLVHYIQNSSSYPPYQHTSADYYSSGEEMFKAMLKELKQAKKFIFLEYFIINKSGMWNQILEILIQKAEEGLDVRLIFDDIGSLSLFNSNYIKELREKNIKIMRFNPVVPFISLFMNHRDHRKIMVIDGTVGFTGGINISDEYINKIERFGFWKDSGIKLKGDAVWSFTLMFIETWNTFSKKKNERIHNYMEYKSQNQFKKKDGLVIPYGDTPLSKERLGENIYIDILSQAKDYITIFTPYLVISEKMLHALSMAAKRGVDVKVVVPGITDKKLVYRLTKSYYKQLIDAGVHIYEYTPGLLHSKVFICDDHIAGVGTINLDYRSLYLHFECAILLYKSSAIKHIKEDVEETLRVSKPVTLVKRKGFIGELIDSILYLFSPLM